MNSFDFFLLDDLKLVYRTLHAHLTEHVDLLDSQFLHDLQGFLQKKARADGVDLADHGQWDAWLGNRYVPCSERVQARRILR